MFVILLLSFKRLKMRSAKKSWHEACLSYKSTNQLLMLLIGQTRNVLRAIKNCVSVKTRSRKLNNSLTSPVLWKANSNTPSTILAEQRYDIRCKRDKRLSLLCTSCWLDENIKIERRS